MRIGIRAHDVAYAPLEELIPNIHAQGFHCMHIALSKSIKEFKPGVETMTPGLAMYIKELCTENKVAVILTFAIPILRSIRRLLRSIRHI